MLAEKIKSAFFDFKNIFFANLLFQKSGKVLYFVFVKFAKFLQGSTAKTFFLEKFLIKTPSLLPISITILGEYFLLSLFAIFLNADLIVIDSDALWAYLSVYCSLGLTGFDIETK